MTPINKIFTALFPEHVKIGPHEGFDRTALGEQVKVHAALVDAVGLSVLAIDAQWGVLYCNPALERMLGWDANRLVGKNLLELSILDDLEVDAVEVIAHVAQGGSWAGNHTARHRDGHHLVLASRLTGLYDRTGQFLAAIVVSTDETDSQRAAIQANRLSELVQSISDAHYEASLDGTITSWNSGAESLYGYSADEAIGQNISMLCADSYAKRAELFQNLTSDTPSTCECQALHKDGSLRSVNLTLSLIHSEAGKPTGFTLVTRDITEQNLVQEELANERERSIRAQRMADVGCFELDMMSGRVTMSEEYSRIHALVGPDRFTREGWLASIHPDDRHRVDKLALDVKQRGAATEMTYRIMDPGNEVRWVTTRVTVQKDDAGNPARLLCTTVDITERKHHEETLRKMAYEDPLTGLGNRAYLYEFIDNALARNEADGPVGVLFLDLGGLKDINDGMGHIAGDEMLVHVARRLQTLVREQDALARFSGDEFAIVCEGLSEASARALAARVRVAFDEPFGVGGREVFANTSIGIAIATDADTAQTLLNHADIAMYTAKSTGQRSAAVFSPELAAGGLDRLRIRSLLPKIVDRGELQMNYQPVMNLTTGRVIGMEALIRWRHPELGNITPDRFIPIAEETGHIVEIGEWTLRQSLKQTARWREEIPGADKLRIAINLSARQLQDPDLEQRIHSAIAEARIEPSALELEITESVLMSDVERSLKILTSLRNNGIGISIDDFGTGYSSLSYLSRFPVSTLKIDRAFVSGLEEKQDRHAQPIIQAVISMAGALKLDVVAEGVETTEQLRRLITLGVDQGQGYLWSPAMTADKVPSWVGLQGGLEP